MKTKFYFLFLCIFTMGYSVNAQYAVTTFTETYSELDNPLSLNIPTEWDDPVFTVPFGFNFEIGGTSITEITQDGLGAGFLYGSFDGGGYFGILDDFADGANANGDPSVISYKVEGSAGNRICKIQYSNIAFYDEVFSEDETSVNRTNFQIWIYEADFAIEMRYGPQNILNPAVYFFGGPQIGVFTGFSEGGDAVETATMLSGDPTNPTPTYSVDIATIEFTSLDGIPEDGRVYRFSQSALSAESEDANEFKIYPSLVIDEFRVSGNSNSNGAVYRIMDLSGKTVDSGIYFENQFINVSSLSSGVYFFATDDMKRAEKFIKQ